MEFKPELIPELTQTNGFVEGLILERGVITTTHRPKSQVGGRGERI